MESRLCSECNCSRSSNEFEWTHDRYGIPWRKVCGDCRAKVQDEIAGYVFDAADAGESLEPDDY